MSRQSMWGGRFAAAPAELMQDYSESMSYDRAMYKQDIAGSKAHAKMLARQGIITEEESLSLRKGLDQVQEEIESGKFQWKKELEDVHMNIENRLTEIVGKVGSKLHTGRSRNDQVALDFRLYVSDSCLDWQRGLSELVRVLKDRAEEEKEVLLPGYTHLQPAQPVSLAQHLLAYASMFKRDYMRLQDSQKRIRVSPLGAAALAGTTYPLDPAFVAQELKMFGVFENSMDAVTDRDFALEALFCASLIMMHLSRLCEDIILWANPGFAFVRLPDTYSTGSSIMPQKKNPDSCELMRGKTGRVYGALFSLLTVMKGLPMTYNRDQQEDKEPFLDVHKTITMSLGIMRGLLAEIKFLPENMKKAMQKGFLNATELADYLVGKGIPFREAHHFSGRAVALAEEKGQSIEKLALEELKDICPEIEADIYNVLAYEAAVERRETHGGTGPSPVNLQLKALDQWLKGLD